MAEDPFAIKSDTNVLEYLRKESLDTYNRLHSIAEDVNFVKLIYEAFPGIPLLPNLRCGEWYTDPNIAVNTPAYFKSTDGHFSNWSFNLRRANLHLLPLIIQHNGMILVDSTRSGKRIPDALSKTVPIWCAVINRAMVLLNPDLSQVKERWDLLLYTAPGAVSSQEHHQIEAKLDGWARALAASSFELPALPHPLRPFWITPATTSFPSFNSPSSDGFLPIICVSASKQVVHGTERRSSGFAYIQGSGDDHELWGMGLSPQLFWTHNAALLGADRSELPELVAQLVQRPAISSSSSSNINPPIPISKVSGKLAVCWISDIPQDAQNVEIDCNSPSHTVPSTTTTAYIVLTSSQHSSPLLSALDDKKDYLHIPIHERKGKKGDTQYLFATIFPSSLAFIKSRLLTTESVCIVIQKDNSDARDVAVGVMLVALQLLFDDHGELLIEDSVQLASKQTIWTRLEWVIASVTAVNPSRTMLKRVNSFLLSKPELRRGA